MAVHALLQIVRALIFHQMVLGLPVECQFSQTSTTSTDVLIAGRGVEASGTGSEGEGRSVPASAVARGQGLTHRWAGNAPLLLLLLLLRCGHLAPLLWQCKAAAGTRCWC